MKKFLIGLIFSLLPTIALAAPLAPFQGGTGIATTSVSNVGKFLRVTSSSPFLLYDFSSVLTATPTLQQITDIGNVTTNALQFNGGTSTANFFINGKVSATTGSFTYVEATSTNFTFGTIGTLTGSNATITNVSTTNLTVSGTLDVSTAAITGLSSADLSDNANVAKLDATQTFTGPNTFSATTTFSTTTAASSTITNLSSTNFSYTSAQGTSLTSTYGNFSNLTFTGATGTSIFANIVSSSAIVSLNGAFNALTVGGQTVCLTNGTNCPPMTFTTPTLQQVTDVGNSTTNALVFAGGTTTAPMVMTTTTIGGTLTVTGTSTLTTTTIRSLSTTGTSTMATTTITGLTAINTANLNGIANTGAFNMSNGNYTLNNGDILVGNGTNTTTVAAVISTFRTLFASSTNMTTGPTSTTRLTNYGYSQFGEYAVPKKSYDFSGITSGTENSCVTVNFPPELNSAQFWVGYGFVEWSGASSTAWVPMSYGFSSGYNFTMYTGNGYGPGVNICNVFGDSGNILSVGFRATIEYIPLELSSSY